LVEWLRRLLVVHRRRLGVLNVAGPLVVPRGVSAAVVLCTDIIRRLIRFR
jgi:hypothetical protein